MTLLSSRRRAGKQMRRYMLTAVSLCLLAVLVVPGGGTAEAAAMCGNKTVTIDMNALGVTKVSGTQGDDVILGTPASDIINGQGGNDTICGGLGIDKIYGRTGNDVIYGEGGTDYIYGDEGNDRVFAGSGPDRVYGGDGDDMIRGGGGQDQIWGGLGDDDINGNWHSDTIYGDAGNDSIGGAGGKDVIYGGAGNDDLRGGTNVDNLYGGAGNDHLDGQSGADVLDGGAGSNTCVNARTEINCAPQLKPPAWVSGAELDIPTRSRFDFDISWGATHGAPDVIELTITNGGNSSVEIVDARKNSSWRISSFNRSPLTEGATYTVTARAVNDAGKSGPRTIEVDLPKLVLISSETIVVDGPSNAFARSLQSGRICRTAKTTAVIGWNIPLVDIAAVEYEVHNYVCHDGTKVDQNETRYSLCKPANGASDILLTLTESTPVLGTGFPTVFSNYRCDAETPGVRGFRLDGYAKVDTEWFWCTSDCNVGLQLKTTVTVS